MLLILLSNYFSIFCKSSFLKSLLFSILFKIIPTIADKLRPVIDIFSVIGIPITIPLFDK